MMRYRVKIIGENDLPEPHDWALVTQDDLAIVFVKWSALRSGVVGRAIADYEANIPRHLNIVA